MGMTAVVSSGKGMDQMSVHRQKKVLGTFLMQNGLTLRNI